MSQELPIDILFTIKDDWSLNGGFTGNISFTNHGEDFKNWTIEFDAPFEINKIWNAEIISHTGNHYVIKNGTWNDDVDAGETITFGFTALVDNKTITEPTNYIFDRQSLDISVSEDNPTNLPTVTESNFIGEIGTITNLDHQGQTIEFKNQYVNPVVFALPLSQVGGDPAIARITEIDNDSFFVYVQEAEYKDGFHAEETLSYLVLEAGTWELENGSILEVGKLDTNKTTTSGWQNINFDTNFDDTPIVLSQVQTDNDSTFVRTRQQQASNNGFQLALEEEEKLQESGHGTETVGWLALESGEGSWNGMEYQAETTGDRVTDQWHTLDFDKFNQTPNLLASVGSYDGGDSVGVRYQNLNLEGVQIRLEEDQSSDTETSHTDETVNFLAIAGEGSLTGTAHQINNDAPDDDDASTPPPVSSPPTLSSQAITVGFENHNVGTEYDRSAQEKDWEVNWVDTKLTDDSAFISDKEAHSGNQSLEISYSPDERKGAGAAWAIPEEREYYLSYWVKFEDNFDFDGSKNSGGKLPGLAGAGGYCSGGDTCNGNNGFSSRYMWGEQGRAKLYLYHMDKPTQWGENFWFKDKLGRDIYFETGQWHNLIQRVKINDGDRANGEIDVWMNGEQVLDIDDLQFVSNNKGIDALMFSTFHGGNSKDFLPEREVHSYFDEIVISTNASDVGL